MKWWKRNAEKRRENLDLLSSWHSGMEGIIKEVVGSSRLACRLRELGIIPGVHFRILRDGSPLVVQIGEGRFCLRRQDAATVRVSRGY